MHPVPLFSNIVNDAGFAVNDASFAHCTIPVPLDLKE